MIPNAPSLPTTSARRSGPAADAGATPQERQNAYARARTELAGLIALPAAAMASIERTIAGELEA